MIVHISRDYPDAIDPRKTKAIATLVELVEPEFDQLVYSLNRAPAPLAALLRGTSIETESESSSVVPVRYEAPGKGVFMKRILDSLAAWICRDLGRHNVRPKLVQGHKISIEGIVAAKVAAHFGCPFALTIQGNSDKKIVSARPDLRNLYARIFRDADLVVSFTPWALNYLEAVLGARRGATAVIPCPTYADRMIEPHVVGPQLITAFQLDDWRNKNAVRMIKAAAHVAPRADGFRFTIYGKGSPNACAALERAIARSGSENIHVAGPVAHDKVQERMNAAAGLVLTSRRESFGLVFTEALLAGCPIVYPDGTAVSGYFDGCPFALPVAHNDVRATADAMLHLVREEADVKAALLQWQRSGAGRRFQRAEIGRAYREALSGALERNG